MNRPIVAVLFTTAAMWSLAGIFTEATGDMQGFWAGMLVASGCGVVGVLAMRR